MDVFYSGWFAGWIRGMDALGEKERARVFMACGKACASSAILPTYQKLLANACDTDSFFTAVNREVDNVSVTTVRVNDTYDFCYPRCLCPLHEECGVNDGLLCECSRESLLYVMRELFAQRKPQVELAESVLKGDPQCRLRVRLF
jgi:hypothetical protein